ncbi:MAG: formylglycine-generating enzyme family protein [Kiritimatiellaeota bacterium]|nr:formylglycine-generating enzyme family protein [Kiritimatiellota bacterium]
MRTGRETCATLLGVVALCSVLRAADTAEMSLELETVYSAYHNERDAITEKATAAAKELKGEYEKNVASLSPGSADHQRVTAAYQKQTLEAEAATLVKIRDLGKDYGGSLTSLLELFTRQGNAAQAALVKKELTWGAEDYAALGKRYGEIAAALRGMPDASPPSPGGGSMPTAQYVVIDLSRGANASSYQVSEFQSLAILPNDTAYKTTKLALRKIPNGTFVMGSPETEVGRRTYIWSGEAGRSTDETRHKVTLSQDYYIGVFEVTQRQYELVMGVNPSETKGYTHPVANVSYEMIRGAEQGGEWPNAVAVDEASFMGKLRAKTGLTFDLPTEAQWEYACRAGTTTALNSGENLKSEYQSPAMDALGHYEGTSRGKWNPQKREYDRSVAVGGKYKANAWGLYDMHGNVREWCLDWRGNFGESGTSDPKGPAPRSSGIIGDRILRGGSFLDSAGGCRSATRYYMAPFDSDVGTGFRVCIQPPEAP